MKKITLCILFCITFYGISFAQNLTSLINDFSQRENVKKEVVSKEMLDASIKQAIEVDPSGMLASQIPPFMQKLDSIVVIDLTPCDQTIKDEFRNTFQTFENWDTDNYETILAEKDNSDEVRIMAKREEDSVSEVVILVISNDAKEVAIIKMIGQINDADVSDIIKEQGK